MRAPHALVCIPVKRSIGAFVYGRGAMVNYTHRVESEPRVATGRKYEAAAL